MVPEEEEEEEEESTDPCQALAHAGSLIPAALSCARSQPTLTSLWSTIISNLQALPPSLSNLSTHPSFPKSPLCLTLLHSISTTLSHLIHLSSSPSSLGKLHLQSHLHSLNSNLQLHLHDCHLLLKTTTISHSDQPLTRLQLGDSDSKHRALDQLLTSMKSNHNCVHATELSTASVAALALLLTHTTIPKIKEKAVSLVFLLADQSESCDSLLASDHLLHSLIKLAQSGSHFCRAQALMSLQRLSIKLDAARRVVSHGGVRVLIQLISEHGHDSITLSAATATLKNLSVLPELMAHDMVVITRVMITIFDSPNAEASKQHAAEFLANVTSIHDESLKSSVISEGGVRSLIGYLDEPLPQEPAISALRNLVELVSVESLVSLGLFPRLVGILRDGTQGSKQAAASTIAKLSSYTEVKELAVESGIVDLLVEMINGKTKLSREAAAQAMAGLMSGCQKNRKMALKKRNSQSAAHALPGLVQLLDWNPNNRASKYAVVCLLCLSSSSKSRRLMIAHGAIGYLKKLTEMGVPGSTELMERLERGKLINLFTRSVS